MKIWLYIPMCTNDFLLTRNSHKMFKSEQRKYDLIYSCKSSWNFPRKMFIFFYLSWRNVSKIYLHVYPFLIRNPFFLFVSLYIYSLFNVIYYVLLMDLYPKSFYFWLLHSKECICMYVSVVFLYIVYNVRLFIK